MGTTSGPIAPHDVADELPTAGAYAVLLILTGVYIIETTDRNMLGVSLIPFIDYSSYEYSLLSGTAFSLFYSIGGVFFSLCVDSGNVNLRTRIFVLTTGGFLVSLTFALTSVVTTFGQLFLLRIFMGLAQSVLTPLSMGILSSCFNGKYRGFAMGFYQIGG
jgi:MFS family permease